MTGTHELFGASDIQLANEEEFKVGTTLFVALATLGHTPENMCYAAYPKGAGEKCWAVFTGAALFVGETGRTELPDPNKTGENAGILDDAMYRKITPLGDKRGVQCAARSARPESSRAPTRSPAPSRQCGETLVGGERITREAVDGNERGAIGEQQRLAGGE